MVGEELDGGLDPAPGGGVERAQLTERAGAMVDEVNSVRRSSLGSRTGRATAAQMVEIGRALLVFLRIAG